MILAFKLASSAGVALLVCSVMHCTHTHTHSLRWPIGHNNNTIEMFYALFEDVVC